MRHEYRVGDRVRVTTGSLARGYLPGCCGTVLAGKEASVHGWEWYYVRMDGEAIGTWALFAAEEVEAETDAAPTNGNRVSASARPESAIAVSSG